MQVCLTTKECPVTNGSNDAIGIFLQHNPDKVGDLYVKFYHGASKLAVTSHPITGGFFAEIGNHVLYSAREGTHAVVNSYNSLLQTSGLNGEERESARKILNEFIAQKKARYDQPRPQTIDRLVERRVQTILSDTDTMAAERLVDQRVQAMFTALVASNKAASDKEAELLRLTEEKRLREEAEAAQKKRIAEELLKLEETNKKMEILLKEELHRLEGLAKTRETSQIATIPRRQITDSINGIDINMMLVCVVVVLVAVILMKPQEAPAPQQDLTPLFNQINQRTQINEFRQEMQNNQRIQINEFRQEMQNNRVKDNAVPSGNAVVTPSWFQALCEFVKSAFYYFIMMIIFYFIMRIICGYALSSIIFPMRSSARNLIESDDDDE